MNWISVDDKLPKYNNRVLVWRTSGECQDVGIAEYRMKNEYILGDYWYFDDEEFSGNDKVIYWMPLPKIPGELKQKPTHSATKLMFEPFSNCDDC